MNRHRKDKQELRARGSQAAGNLWLQDTGRSCWGLLSRRGRGAELTSSKVLLATRREQQWDRMKKDMAVVSLGPRRREA